MNFVQSLNSLDELLYELSSWLIFFPVSLWRVIRHPLTTMRYAERQLLLEPDRQYHGTVSPPIMLILSIVIVQGLDLAVGNGTNPNSDVMRCSKGEAHSLNEERPLSSANRTSTIEPLRSVWRASVQALVLHATVERFHEGIVGRLARTDL